MGRARTDRTVQRVVRLSAEEDQFVGRQAAELGLTPAAFLRQAALKKLPARSGVLGLSAQKEIWHQVSGMARNLNQLTKYAHSGKLQTGELASLSIEVRGLVTRVLELTKGGDP